MYRYFCQLSADNEIQHTDISNTLSLYETSFSFWDISSRRQNKYIFSQISSPILDLLYISCFVYLADCASPRSQTITNWERNIRVDIPVLNVDLMDSIKPYLIDALNFLSGDYWEINFRSRDFEEIEKYQRAKISQLKITEQFDCVSMLSGGLDSCIAAIDLLEENKKTLFVGCHGRGASVKPYQTKIFTLLKNKYNISQNQFKQFSLERKANGQIGELTTRSRSFHFFMHGIAMADVYNVKQLIIPENGVISLNVPLTWSRIGSSSTRTTHPHYMALLNTILQKLESPIRLINPYQFKTKGEMMSECKNKDLLSNVASLTMSCSHPSDRYSGEGCIKDSHCGYCVPCTIRRAAFKKSNIIDNSIYRDPESDVARQNFRSFEIGILSKKSIGTFDILKSGPIPDIANYSEYLNLYTRGIKEIKDYLSNDE